MEIEFDLTAEDFVDFNVHLNQRRSTGRRLLVARWVLMAMQILVLVAIFYPQLSVGGSAFFLALVPALAVVGFWALVVPYVYRMWVRSQVMAVITDKRARLGHHQLTLATAGIVDRTEDGETTTAWHEIEEIATTRKHILLYDGPASAYVVPRRAFASPEALETFEAAALDFNEQASRHVPAADLSKGEI